MIFERAWVLWLAWLPLAWAAWEWRTPGRRAGLVLKAAAFLAVMLALAEPRVQIAERRVGVAILADTSASVSDDDLRAESQFAQRVDASRRRNWTRVIPFARSTRETVAAEQPKGTWQLQHTAGDTGHATNLESAIRDAAGALPAGFIPRILLMSDGIENQGSATRAIWQAQQLGIRIDTMPLAGRPKPGLRLDSVGMPAQVFSGERFPIDLTIEAPKAAAAHIEVLAEGKPLGSNPVRLAQGVNHVRVEAGVNATGAVSLSGQIAAEGMGEVHFEDALTLRPLRALLISDDPPPSEAHLLRTLQANQYDVQLSRRGVPSKLDGFQLVVINNWNMQAIGQLQQGALESFVKKGGGLLWVAGEHNVYADKHGAPEDPLERTLPARIAPPRSQESTAVVLIIDKSSSMQGKKSDLSKLAASGVVDNLRPTDYVGVIEFDNTFRWSVPIRLVEDPGPIKRLIAGITPDGGTQIAPALAEAYRRIRPVDAIYKHIVLLTDGISEEGDANTTARDAKANRITISTVGLGLDVNRSFLEVIASLAEGKSYFLSEPEGLEQLLLRDVEEHSGLTAVEKPLKPAVLKQADILKGVGMEQAPALLGYIRFLPRPTADNILEAERGEPLFARWQYGLGRAAVFTSDAKPRWAANWVTWDGFDRWWANVFHDLLPHAPGTETKADFDRATGELVVNYQLSRDQEEPKAVPDIYAFGPDGFHAPLRVSKVAAGHYTARLALGQRQGLFRVRPQEDSRAFPEVGLYRQEDEMLEYGNDDRLLRQVAAATGGRFQPTPGQVFDPGGRSVSSTLELWPLLLGLAVLLNLAELVLRKWKGVREQLRFRPRPAEAV